MLKKVYAFEDDRFVVEDHEVGGDGAELKLIERRPIDGKVSIALDLNYPLVLEHGPQDEVHAYARKVEFATQRTGKARYDLHILDFAPTAENAETINAAIASQDGLEKLIAEAINQG